MGAKGQTVRLSIFIFLHFTPFNSYLTTLTSIYEEEGLPEMGPASLGINYLFFIISTILAPSVKAPLKNQFLFGGLCYSLSYASGILAGFTSTIVLKFIVTCTGSALAGFSAGFLWVSIGRYVHLACEKYNQLDRKGEMYGIVNSSYCLSNVSAGLITTFGLGFFDAQIYFAIETVIGLMAIMYCAFFVRNISEKSRLRTNTQTLLGDQLTENQDYQQETPEQQQSTWTSVKNTVLFTKQMYAVLILMVMDGLATAVYSSEIAKLVPLDTPDDKADEIAGIIIISLGVGSVIGSYICGIIADKIGGLVSGRLGLAFWVSSCGCFLAAQIWQSLWMAQITGFMWGFSMFYLEGWLYIVISRNYNGLAEAFSVNKQFHSWFYLFFQITVFTTKNVLPMKTIMITMAALAIPAFLLMNRVPNIRAVKDTAIEESPRNKVVA